MLPAVDGGAGLAFRPNRVRTETSCERGSVEENKQANPAMRTSHAETTRERGSVEDVVNKLNHTGQLQT